MDVDRVEAGLIGPGRGIAEGLDDALDLGDVQFAGGGVAGEVQRGRGDGLPATLVGRHAVPVETGVASVDGRLASGMGQLHRDGSTLLMHEIGDPPPGRDVGVVPQPDVLRGDPAGRLDSGGFGDQQAEPADRTRTQVHQVPVIGHPVASAGHVLAHRGEPDAVGDGQPGQGNRFKQVHHVLLLCQPGVGCKSEGLLRGAASAATPDAALPFGKFASLARRAFRRTGSAAHGRQLSSLVFLGMRKGRPHSVGTAPSGCWSVVS